MSALIDGLILFSLIATGVMAGVYFAFSAFVIRSLDVIDAPLGMLAMQSINRVILQSVFLPLFFVSSASCGVLVVVGALDTSAPGALAMLSGSAFYLTGMLLVTLVGNVPLNNALEQASTTGPEALPIWRRYVKHWTIWNHIRTVSCVGALILFAIAFAARG